MMQKRRRWNSHEIRTLLAYPEVGVVGIAALLPWRTINAITSEARKLGLRRRRRRWEIPIPNNNPGASSASSGTADVEV